MRELQDAVQRHPGKAAEGTLRSIERIRLIQRANFEQLADVLNAPDHSPDLVGELFQNTREPTVREAYQQVFATAFHNYIASVRTLVDHTRAVVRRVERPAFVAEYERRLGPVRESSCAAFMARFRNYVIHYRFPRFVQEVHLQLLDRDPEEPVLRMLLSRDHLLEWDGWSAGAKAYLRDQPEQFDIREPLQEYDDLITALYDDWFFPAFWAAHREDIAGVGALIKEYNTVVGGGPETFH
ncbi:hypothetical protein GCM10009623_25790 [Nocardioides aestuarii]